MKSFAVTSTSQLNRRKAGPGAANTETAPTSVFVRFLLKLLMVLSAWKMQRTSWQLLSGAERHGPVAEARQTVPLTFQWQSEFDFQWHTVSTSHHFCAKKPLECYFKINFVRDLLKVLHFLLTTNRQGLFFSPRAMMVLHPTIRLHSHKEYYGWLFFNRPERDSPAAQSKS